MSRNILLLTEEDIYIYDGEDVYFQPLENFFEDGYTIPSDIRTVDYNEKHLIINDELSTEKTLPWIDTIFSQFQTLIAKKEERRQRQIEETQAREDLERRKREYQEEQERIAAMSHEDWVAHYTDLYSSYAQDYIDSVVQKRGYDDILSCLSYINSTNPIFKREAEIANVFRDRVWERAYEIINQINEGDLQPMAEVIFKNMLPAINWNENL